MKIKKVLGLVLATALTLSIFSGCSSNAGGESGTGTDSGSTWPNSAVQVLVPSSAGGLTDIHTRQLTQWWQNQISESLAVVNYDNGSVAYENVRSAKTDGSTLMMQHTGLVAQYLTGAVEFNPAEEFSIIAKLQYIGDQAIIASPDAPYDNFAEMIDYAKDHPGELSAGIAFNATTHLIWGNIMNETGAEFKLVESANETDKLTNVAGGFIDLGNVTLSNAKQYEESGMIKVLGVLTGDEKHNELYPEWDPLVVQGYDVTWASNFYLFGPKDMDEETVEAINVSLKNVTEDEEFSNAIAEFGGRAEWYNVKESQDSFNDEIEKTREITDLLGISAYE